MKYRKILKIIAFLMVFAVFSSLTCIFNYTAYAADSIHVDGLVYSFDGKAHYEYSSCESSEAAVPGNNTYGNFSVVGDLSSDGSIDGVPSFLVNGETAELVYSYADAVLNADDEQWHLVEDKTKKVDEITLPSNIKYGAMILQTSKDGAYWSTDLTVTNLFEDTPSQTEAFYAANSIQLANGCFYRVIVVYKTAIKVGQNQFLFVKTNDVEYKKTVEVYEFYLHDNSASSQESTVMTRNLGSVTNTGKDNGYSGINVIDIKDPHYGWEIGHFFVSGYTRETKDDSGTPVFLKNVGDQITLWFNLKQDIDQLNGDTSLSIADDINGYDQYFQTEKTDMGRGALIIRYTDERGIKHEPEIYTDYLKANASTSADTIVRLFEEGDYEIALDYEIKSVPRKVGSVEVIPEYTNYRIYFNFSVRNGNCMVYPFDVVTGDELPDEAITPNGFRLDIAKSRYLTIDVERSVVTEGSNGYTEDTRFNRPAKDGDAYTDDGIYVFSVKNLYTGESTAKTIYVGSVGYMKALSVNQISVSQLNALLEQGASIDENGTISMSTPSVVSETPDEKRTEEVDEEATEVKEESTEENTSTKSMTTVEELVVPTPNNSETETGETTPSADGNSLGLPLIVGSIAIVTVMYALIIRKKHLTKEGAKK